ncbi:MAG: hypothetical protein ACRCZL_00030 [Cetobacterium sp.]
MEKTTINLVNVLKAVGYSATAVKGQKTRLAKLALGLDGDIAKSTFMFEKGEVLEVLNVVMKSKSDKAEEATKVFDKISKGEYTEDWTEEYSELTSGGKEKSASKKNGASGRKGTNEDRKSFIESKGLDAEFRAWMEQTYGA